VRLYDKIHNMDVLRIGVEASVYALSTPARSQFYLDRMEAGKSLELSFSEDKVSGITRLKYLYDVSYRSEFLKALSKDPSFPDLNFMSLSFLGEDVWFNKAFSLKGMHQGWDINLSRPRILSLLITLKPIVNDFKHSLKTFVLSKAFSLLTVDQLLSYESKLVELQKSFEFYKLPLQTSESKVVENPLKVLDFIKESQTKENAGLFKIKSDFMHFENQIVSSEFVPIDHSPSFRPKFNFTIRKK